MLGRLPGSAVCPGAVRGRACTPRHQHRRRSVRSRHAFVSERYALLVRARFAQSLPQRRLRRQGLDPERMCENRVFSVEARICEGGAGVAEHARQGQQNVTVADRIAAANLEVLRQVLSCWFP